MKVQVPGNVGRAQPIRRKTIEKTRASSGVSATAPVRNINDTTSVLGIPSAEMTPKVKNAIITLMAEVDHMRGELEIAH